MSNFQPEPKNNPKEIISGPFKNKNNPEIKSVIKSNETFAKFLPLRYFTKSKDSGIKNPKVK